jgi:hypothetical protein
MTDRTDTVVSEPRRRWLLVAAIVPAIALTAAAIFLGRALVATSGSQLQGGLLLLAAALFFTSDVTERIAIRPTQIEVRRPPWRTRRYEASSLARIVKETRSLWLVHVGRRHPIKIRLHAFINGAEVRSALEGLAAANGIPIEESPIYRDLEHGDADS